MYLLDNTFLYESILYKMVFPQGLFNQFSELNQGQQYLQKKKYIQSAMKDNLKLIESFTGNISDTQDPSGYFLAENRGGYNINCPLKGRLSWCHYNSDKCPNYNYCPPGDGMLEWQKDGYCGPNGDSDCAKSSNIKDCVYCNNLQQQIDDLIDQQQELYQPEECRDSSPPSYCSSTPSYMDRMKHWIHNRPLGNHKGKNVILRKLTNAAEKPHPPYKEAFANLTPKGNCNYLNVCVPNSGTFSKKKMA